MTDTLARIEAEVCALPEREDMTPERACELLDGLDVLARRVRDARQQLEDFLIEWMPANQVRELIVGDVRKFVTEKKRDKCLSIPAAVQALYEATGGDFDAFCDCLSSNAIKYGQAKKVLGDKYAQHFETIRELGLDSKPVKVLASVNERFIK